MVAQHTPKSHEIILRTLGRAGLAAVAACVFAYWTWNPQEPPPIEDEDGLVEPKRLSHEERAVEENGSTPVWRDDPAESNSSAAWTISSITANARQEAADLSASTQVEMMTPEGHRIQAGEAHEGSNSTGTPHPRAPP